MGGRVSRNKGRAGEQSLVRLINDWFGDGIARRNLDQVTTDGGAGGDVGGELQRFFSIECKASKQLQTAYFRQARDQAADHQIPVVAHKETGTGKFRFYVLLEEKDFLEYAGEVMSAAEIME